jgi:hypothetical protein
MTTIGRLNHIGIAVPSIEKTFETYKRLYGATEMRLSRYFLPTLKENVPGTEAQIVSHR